MVNEHCTCAYLDDSSYILNKECPTHSVVMHRDDYDKLKGDVDRLTKKAHALWQILDDIDTAGDMYKGDYDALSRYALDKSEERSKYFVSLDGYTLTET
jgi:hypothetical protein